MRHCFAAPTTVIPAKAGTQYAAALVISLMSPLHCMSALVQGYVYILASRIGGTLYIGMTSDLAGRVYQHKSSAAAGFTKTYKVDRLVYYEVHDSVEAAIL